MTIYDLINLNPWMIYLVLGLAIVILGILIIGLVSAYRDGREINLFGIKIGSRSHSATVTKGGEYQRTLARSKEFLGSKISAEYLEKVAKLRSKISEQAITSLALRSRIHLLLLDISIDLHGGFAGIGYPGRKLYLEFTTDHLAGTLPEFIDANNPTNIQDKIRDFFSITEPNIYGVEIPEDDYQVALQLGVYVLVRLEKIEKLIKERRKKDEPVDFYTEADLDKIKIN